MFRWELVLDSELELLVKKSERYFLATINNPRFSRPIDVHRWSEHPEVKGMVDVIWQDYLPVELTEKEDKRGPGPRPKTIS